MENPLEITPGYYAAEGLSGSIKAYRLQKEVDRQNKEISKKRTELLNLAKKETDENKKRIYLEQANSLKNVALEDLTKVVSNLPTAKQVAASSAELGLTLVGGSVGKAVSGGYKALKSAQLANKAQIAATVFDDLTRAYEAQKKTSQLSKTGKLLQTGKSILGSTLEGAGFGALTEVAMNKEATPQSITQSALTVGALGGGLNIAGRAIGAGIELAGKSVSPKLGELYKTFKTKISEFSEGKLSEDNAINRIKNTIETEKNVFQKMAGKTIDVLDGSELAINKFLNRFHPIKEMEEKIWKLKGLPLEDKEQIYTQVRLLNAKVDEATKKEWKTFISKVNQFENVKEDSKVYLKALDDYDRAQNGQLLKVVDGKTVKVSSEEAYKELQEVVNIYSAQNKLEDLEKIRAIWKEQTTSELLKMKNAGLISEEEIRAMQEAHPNYIPHDVLLEKQTRAYSKLSLNVSEDGFKKAVGSIRDIKDPYSALMARTQLLNRKIAQNELLTNIIDTGKKYGMEGFRPIQTAQKVKERNNFISELKGLKRQKEILVNLYKKSNKEDKKLLSKINKISKEIDSLSKDAIQTFLKEEEPAQAKKLIAQLTIKEKLPITNKGLIGSRGGKTITNVTERGTYNTLKIIAKNSRELKDILKDAGIKQKDIEDIVSRVKVGQYKSGSIILDQKNVGATTRKYIDDLINKLRNPPNKEIEKLKNKISIGEKKLSKLEEEKYIGEQQMNLLLSDIDVLNKKLKDTWLNIKKTKKGLVGSGEETINLFREGIKETWVAPKDIVVAIKGTDIIPPTGVLNVVASANNIFKELTTTLNPSFAIPNKFRDEQTALITAQSFIQEMVKKTGVTPKQVNLTSEELKELYKKSGGIGASIYKDGDETMLKGLEDAGIMKFVKDPTKALSALSNELEQTTRLEVFRMGLQNGLSPDNAALVARDATIDFSKMGTVMQTLNKAIPFLNARVQGFANLGRVIKNNPEMFMRTQMLTAVYPAMALDKWNQQWDSYKNISQEIKNKYWIIVFNEMKVKNEYGEDVVIPQFITVPKGEGQTLVANPVQYYLERARVKDPRSVNRMLIDTLGSASPLEFQRFSVNNPFLTAMSQFGVLGTLTGGYISGKDPYFGTDLYSRDTADTYNYLQSLSTTPEYLKKLSEIMANPDENGKPRGVSISPSLLNFTINSLGGVPQSINKLTDLIYGTATGKKPPKQKTETITGKLTQIPVAERFVREAYPYYSPEAQGEKERAKAVVAEEKAKKVIQKERLDNAVQDFINARNSGDYSGNELKEYWYNYIVGYYQLNEEEQLKVFNDIKDILNKTKSRRVGQITENQSIEVRARLIYENFKRIKKEEGQEAANQYQQELIRKKLLTEDVFKYMMSDEFQK